MKNNEDLQEIYVRYNTSVAIDKNGSLYMWGEDTFNMRLRKPKLFYKFHAPIEKLALGKRHGVTLLKNS
jgi:hypothetical protein